MNAQESDSVSVCLSVCLCVSGKVRRKRFCYFVAQISIRSSLIAVAKLVNIDVACCQCVCVDNRMRERERPKSTYLVQSIARSLACYLLSTSF